jgi:arylsulfatase A-like enzyme
VDSVTSSSDVSTKAESVDSSTSNVTTTQLGAASLLAITCWSGLVAGVLEVGTFVIRKRLFDADQLFKTSHHFVWLVPLSNLCVFLSLGFVGCVIIVVWPRNGRWLFTRVLGALILLPSLLVAAPRIYSLAWLVMALGIATWLLPLVECRSRGFRRIVIVTFPAVVGLVAILGASIWVGDWKSERRAREHPLPPPGSPNVILIVMDTVAAGHLGLQGYHRATSISLAELAERGIRFDSARATSSWTLPSHASMFTGRWYHELSVGWVTPLDRSHPTIAEFLGDRGYATAGFIANSSYCGTDSGLARGFARYHDYIFPELTALKLSVLVNRALDGFQAFSYFTADWLESAGIRPTVDRLWRSLENDRKGAATVNREVLDWLTRHTQPERPFFAFLNYFDAHFPYQLEPGRLHRFGAEPVDSYQRVLIQHWFDIDKTTLSPEGVAFATDAYDDCIADLDEQLGKLVDELEQRGLLQRTWLIITSDHGESFGEHAGVFTHGSSLYQSELHVPLLIVPPGGTANKQVVGETVSLRDVAATIADLTGFSSGSPFPGDSLARFWKAPRPPERSGSEPALSELVPTDRHSRDDWNLPRQLSPLGAIKEDRWTYIRRADDGYERLFDLRDDPREQRNLADDPAARSTLESMRTLLDRLTAGPLSTRRFGR